MTTPITTSTTDSQMHNNIMAAGSRDRLPMLATRRYAQWQSRFLRYIDIRPNGDAMRKYILEGPYQPTTVTIPDVPATKNSPPVPEQTAVETILTMSPENKAQYEKPCLYEISYDQSDPANRLVPDREETMTLKKESRSKLNKDLVRPYDYTKLNSLYENFKPTSHEYHEQLAHANEMAERDIPPPTITAMKIPIIRKEEYNIWSIRMRQYICHTDHNLWDVIVNGDLEEEPAPTTGETSAPPAPKTAKQLAARRNQERVKSILLFCNTPHDEIPPQIALIMRNKPDIDEIDIDDLYNNLRVYEDELKSTASGDFGVSTAGGINQVPSTPCAHDIAYSFLAQPTTSP
ncbi:hypothetical protein Tco_1311746 [Tanacetum coccineum]